MRIEPNAPGSKDAVKRGCTCPQIDNQHGRGFQGKRGCFIVTARCPVHDPRPAALAQMESNDG